jgi:predicted ester cyclase
VGTDHHARHPARAVHGDAATGKAFAVTTVNEERIENGKLVEEWGVTDTLAIWQQLGLMPASS